MTLLKAMKATFFFFAVFINCKNAVYSSTTSSPPPSSLALKPADLPPPSTNSLLHKIKVLSHKASYDITLLTVQGDEDIYDVKGVLTIQLIDTIDGWAVEQKSNLIIYDSAGEGEQINTTSSSWEAKDGSRYRFYVRTLQNTQEDIIEGDAIKNEGTNFIQVRYKVPESLVIHIPPQSLFPTNFIIKALENAARGLKFFSTIVFDGSSETHEPVEVNTVFGCRGEQNLVLLTKEGSIPSNVSFWPMNMAVYPLKSKGPDAEYEISQVVMETGIIKSMTLDFGAFKVTATLNQVDLLK